MPVKKHLIFTFIFFLSAPAFSQGPSGTIVRKTLTNSRIYIQQASGRSLTKGQLFPNLGGDPVSIVNPPYKPGAGLFKPPANTSVYRSDIARYILPRQTLDAWAYDVFKLKIKGALAQLNSLILNKNTRYSYHTKQLAKEIDMVLIKMERAYPGDAFIGLMKKERDNVWARMSTYAAATQQWKETHDKATGKAAEEEKSAVEMLSAPAAPNYYEILVNLKPEDILLIEGAEGMATVYLKNENNTEAVYSEYGLVAPETAKSIRLPEQYLEHIGKSPAELARIFPAETRVKPPAPTAKPSEKILNLKQDDIVSVYLSEEEIRAALKDKMIVIIDDEAHKIEGAKDALQPYTADIFTTGEYDAFKKFLTANAHKNIVVITDNYEYGQIVANFTKSINKNFPVIGAFNTDKRLIWTGTYDYFDEIVTDYYGLAHKLAVAADPDLFKKDIIAKTHRRIVNIRETMSDPEYSVNEYLQTTLLRREQELKHLFGKMEARGIDCGFTMQDINELVKYYRQLYGM